MFVTFYFYCNDTLYEWPYLLLLASSRIERAGKRSIVLRKRADQCNIKRACLSRTENGSTGKKVSGSVLLEFGVFCY